MTNEQKLVGIIDAIDVLAPVGEHLINTPCANWEKPISR